MALFNSFIFDTSKGETPESIARKRAIAAQIMGHMQPRSARNVGEGWGNALASIGQGITANVMNRRANAAESTGKEGAGDIRSQLIGAIGSGGAIEPATSYLGGVPVGDVDRAPLDPVSDRVAQAHGVAGSGILPSTMLSALDSTEGGGAYDTLFGYANRSGPFAGVDVSQMSVGDALAFADPRGQYAQHVKSQIGRVATPMGRHQIVGTTLRNAVNQLGIDPSTPFNSTTQDAIALHLAKNRVNSASSLDGKISALRSEWEGFKNVPRDQMAQIVAEIETAPDPAQVLRGVSLPAGIGSESLVGRPLPEGIGMEPMAYAPQPQAGALAAAPFPSAGLPTDTGKGDRLTMPENQLTMDYAPMQGGDYVDPVMAPRPIGGLTGQVAPNDPGPWGMGMDPNNPATIPAMAGGTRDILPAGSPGQFPAAPMHQQAPQQAMQGQGAQGGGFMNLPPQLLLDAISNPFMDEGTKAFASSVLEMQMQAQDPYRQAQMAKMQREASGIGDAAKVQSSVVLDDGTSVLVMNNGERRVLSPTGEVVTGQAAADAIRAAREYTVQNQQDIYGGRRAGTLGADIEMGGAAAGAKKSGEKTMEAGFSAWEDYNKIQGSIANIDEAIAALDNGAKAGIVYNMLPNVTEASASLKNAMDRMGLDIIGSVTFGALSEGEMRLAMDTAAPRHLGPKELRSWLARKRDAQEKAARMLSDAAMFLTVPGNTINDWIAQNRARKQGSAGGGTGTVGTDGWQEHNGVRIRRKQ